MFSRDRKTVLAEWWWTVDKELLAGLMLLMAAGVVLSFAASPPVAERLGLGPWHFVIRQAMFAALALPVMIGASFLSHRQARVVALVVLATTELVPLPEPRPAAALGSALAMAVASSFTSQAIAVAFDRRWGVLRMLATTPLGPRGLLPNPKAGTVGPDIGGFAGRCTGPLLARWMGIGCLFPFARNHNMKSMPEQEPWVFGADVEATSRRALERRYRLLPYLYTLARDAADTGLPKVAAMPAAAPAASRVLRSIAVV